MPDSTQRHECYFESIIEMDCLISSIILLPIEIIYHETQQLMEI